MFHVIKYVETKLQIEHTQKSIFEITNYCIINVSISILKTLIQKLPKALDLNQYSK